jgi:transcriptional regulator with XRE-family HTH domain
MAKQLIGRVRQLREAFGLSQEAFAEKAGLKYKHYQAVEAGRKSDLRFSTLQKLAAACNLELWQLLNFEIEPAGLAESQAAYGPGGPRPRTRPKAKPRSA